MKLLLWITPSADESVSYLKNLDLPIRIIENEENVSFSKGNNDAAKIANGEYILLLNNDIEPTYGWLNEMVGAIVNDEDAASVGAKNWFFHFMKTTGKSHLEFSIVVTSLQKGCILAVYMQSIKVMTI